MSKLQPGKVVGACAVCGEHVKLVNRRKGELVENRHYHHKLLKRSVRVVPVLHKMEFSSPLDDDVLIEDDDYFAARFVDSEIELPPLDQDLILIEESQKEKKTNSEGDK